MIIVEGPDGAGKSTLIEYLVEQTGMSVAPRVVGKDTNAMTDLVTWVEDNVSRGFQYTIFDRYRLISEPIYASAMGRNSPGFDDVQWLAKMFALFHTYCTPVVIYCLPPFEVVKEHVEHDDTNQPTRVQREIRRIYNMYVAKAAADVIAPRTMVYDYTVQPPEHVLNFINLCIGRITNEYRHPVPRIIWE